MEFQASSFVLGGVCSFSAALIIHRLLGMSSGGDKSSATDSSTAEPTAPAPTPKTAWTGASAGETQAVGEAVPSDDAASSAQEKMPNPGFLLKAEKLTRHDTVIICSYQLPVKVTRAANGFTVAWDHDRGLNKTGMNLPARLIYVGCISLQVEPDEEDELEALLLEKFGCVVVFLGKQLEERFYKGFCRGYLSPILHNQMWIPRESDPFVETEWRAYCQANQIFASKVMEVYDTGHLIWVHDYHLLLLPSCILRKHGTAMIGLFLHCPFPSSDVWRCTAVREELLRAMLSADLLGFLLFEYTRNFLTCCKRMMGLEYEFHKGGFLGIDYNGRHVMLQVSTFGVSPQLVRSRMQTESSSDTLAHVQSALAAASVAGTRPLVAAGVDYLDRLKGVSLKLLAWEALLTNYPKFQKGYVLVQVCLGMRNQNGLSSSPEIRAEIESIAKRINDHFPGSVCLEVVEDISCAERLQLWQLADVFVSTAIREAVNIWPLEYVFCRGHAKLPAGSLVLSEFTGFAHVLNGAIRVNPFSNKELVEGLETAFKMAPDEKAARAEKDQRHISTHTMEDWARRFLVDLKMHSKSKRDEDYMAVGFGLNSFRMVGIGPSFKALQDVEALDSYERSSNRALLLDWGGTITAAGSSLYDKRDNVDHVVPANVIKVLTALCANPSNHVMILSGLSKDKVDAAFAAVPNLSLAVEHGFWYRIKKGPWQQLVPGVDTSWREVAQSIMSMYALRTNGAFVQSKGSSILWDFSGCDPEFGAMQAKEVQTTLQDVLQTFPVVVRAGKGYVEACFKDVNKGAMASKFTDMCSFSKKLDFVFCVGDDSTDELMFAALHAKFGKLSEDPKLFTVTVGRKPSEASAYLGDHQEVVELLEAFAQGRRVLHRGA